MLYLDSSAIVKLVRTEPGSGLLRSYLAAVAEPRLCSSRLALVEVLRAAQRQEPSPLLAVQLVLSEFTLIAIDETILDVAARLGPPTLRTLDAIHLASALALEDALEAVVTYDTRMTAAATALGIPVAAPA